MQQITFIPYKQSHSKKDISANFIHSSCLNLPKDSSQNKTRQLTYNSFNSPVIFMCNGIGDGFLALPTIRALSHFFPNSLTIIYDAYIAPTWLYELPLKKIILVEVVRKKQNILFDYISVSNILQGSDLFISFNYGYHAAIYALVNLLEPKFSIGFDASFDAELYQDHCKHASEIYYEAAKLLSVHEDIKTYCYPPKILFSIENIVKNLFSGIKNIVDGEAFILAIHTDTQPCKMWNQENWIIFIENFLNDFSNGIIVILGVTFEFNIHESRVVDLTKLPIDMSMALLKQCNAFIGVDSCMLHIADLFNIASVGLFIGTSHKVYGLKYSPHYLNLVSNKKNCVSPDDALEAIKKVAFN
jgi:ADP-heptose:LPS heptosyltransferase